MRILVVDDTSLIRTQMRMILAKHGHEVFEAADVSNGMAIFCKEQPDFVFTDLYLAGESGLDLFSELSAMFPEVPFVLITISRDEKDLKAARAIGMRDVIQKPIVPDLLLKILEKHRPTDSQKRLVKMSLAVESRIADKARELARGTENSAESIIQNFLHENFDASENAPSQFIVHLEKTLEAAAVEASKIAKLSVESYICAVLKKTLLPTAEGDKAASTAAAAAVSIPAPATLPATTPALEATVAAAAKA